MILGACDTTVPRTNHARFLAGYLYTLTAGFGQSSPSILVRVRNRSQAGYQPYFLPTFLWECCRRRLLEMTSVEWRMRNVVCGEGPTTYTSSSPFSLSYSPFIVSFSSSSSSASSPCRIIVFVFHFFINITIHLFEIGNPDCGDRSF